MQSYEQTAIESIQRLKSEQEGEVFGLRSQYE